MVQRPIWQIAADIRTKWRKPYFGAVPYLTAMHSLSSIDDTYGADSAKEIILYFLSNAATFSGAEARGLKDELKKIAGIK